ncbi:pyridoxal phosphate-dependent aminotransferase [Streptomyces malaysiensis]|uniref:pyridoxal phosphate-dependent aminotransferase n=1 Tax=Streptomyces malaysiensis TaxID=92644 RepID=UPI002B2A5BA5|nr:pyridoxal phosphate-dependent aminotransferase [Streptomyces malaysiensis]
MITHGASAGLAATILALVTPGDRVVIPEPTYSLYADHVAPAGGEPVRVPGFDLDRIKQELPRARLVIVCNSNTPTGAALGEEERTALAQLVNTSDTHLLLDEAYSDIVFDGPFHSGLRLPTDRAVCCGTFSKTFAMTGWHIGHVVAPATVADQINLVHRSLNGAVNTFVQDAALAALPSRRALAADAVVAYRERRDHVVERLSGLPGGSMDMPRGALYALPRVRSGLSSEELTARLAASGVLVRAGSEYGPSGEGHLRLSYATSLELLDEGLNRLCAVLNQGGTP